MALYADCTGTKKYHERREENRYRVIIMAVRQQASQPKPSL
jgi:hypothetical protein